MSPPLTPAATRCLMTQIVMPGHTFVAVDEAGRPRPVPPLELYSEQDPRRFGEAERRRHQRLEATGREDRS